MYIISGPASLLVDIICVIVFYNLDVLYGSVLRILILLTTSSCLNCLEKLKIVFP